MIILFIYFEIHSCSEDRVTGPGPEPPVTSSIICDAKGIYFLNDEFGWVIGTLGTAIGTIDGGRTWQGCNINRFNLNDVFFHDTENGWVVGKEGSIYTTVDGGTTWENVEFGGFPPDDDLYQVVFMSTTLGFVLGYHGVFRTDDGGTTWVNNWLPVTPYRGAWDMCMIDDYVGYLLGSRWNDPDPELLYKTEDGGMSWSAVEGSKSSVLQAVLTIAFVDELTGWAGGGVIMKTTDGGQNWARQLADATVRRFFFLDKDHGFAVGGRVILRTVNGGEHWMDVTPEDERIVDLRSVQFLDGSRGWIVGRGREERVGVKTYKHSLVLSTSDGGDNWKIEDFPFDYTEYLSEGVDTLAGGGI
jgi:photosystem II stability/assembly factor-like uncharacterized protein